MSSWLAELIIVIILLTSFLFILYALIHLIYVFIKRVICRDECKVGCGMLISAFFLFIMLHILIVNYLRTPADGEFTACQSNCNNIGSALEMYSTDHGGKYPESLGELSPDYLKSIPKCPNEERVLKLCRFEFHPWRKPKDTYSPSYQAHNDPTGNHCRFTFCCAGENHKTIIWGNYPQYNTEQGLFNGHKAE